MFKKLLTVVALAAGIALTGGIGTAFALDKCPDANSSVKVKKADKSGVLYERYVVNPDNNFANVFTRHEPRLNKTIKWYFKARYGRTGACDYNGRTAYAAYYEGREK
ncbi:hypothetical protein B5C26_09050 [Photorhabdus luminescens]|uniref:hypothetical protein n=1 Tax=Photorhabdus luminescens TaxID=29488 RepID=UPI000B4CA114|nr:hypothetical protein [Photorhabdus luminescens]OWO82520.1 hypothetical protein B5C26_09050 [Photorhabdus luminescens]